jgi:xanthine dehydrogenase YagR molybdenum-binding subunit
MSDPEVYYVADDTPETPGPSTKPGAWKDTDVVGKRRHRVDGYERVSGTAVYPSDLNLPGTLYGAILRCPHAHARVNSVDLGPAEGMPGVRAVIGPQTPEADLIWSYSSEVSTRLFDAHCRFAGEAVAAVAADTPQQAADALRAIVVDYEVLDHVSDERKALDEAAPKIHEGGNTVGESGYERGDVEKGFAEADVVRERSYRTEAELHTPLELHGCVARWDGDKLNIWESTQGVYAVQSLVANTLGLPLSHVRVIGHYLGGGFGAKLQASKYTVIAALLARRTAKPVKLFLTREETYTSVGNRPPSNMRLKAGVTKEGKLTALEFDCVGTGGAYPAGGTSLVDWLVRDLYTCPNVKTHSTDVYINAGPARPFRAPGHPQGAWALEQMIDELAEAIGMCPVQLRLKNIPAYSQAREGNPPYTTTGLEECIRKGAEVFGWQEAKKRTASQSGRFRRGVGSAACLWIAGGGGPPSTIIVKLFRDGSANLNMGASDIGTGTKTIMAMVVAEELGIPIEKIDIENADTGTTQYATPSGGSKTVPTESPAVRDAAVAVKQKVLEMASEDLGVPVSQLELRDGQVIGGGQSKKITEISGLRRRGVLVGLGHRGPNPQGKVVNPFAAQFCEVEVDTATGEVKILRFVGTNESGRVMNRMTYDNQVFGGIAMGIGLSSTEVRVLDQMHTGRVLSKNWHDYKIPTALDVPPEMVSEPIEMPDPEANTTGSKGLGEPVTIPTAAAVANAVYDAIGIRVSDTPLNPTQLAALLAERKEG